MRNFAALRVSTLGLGLGLAIACRASDAEAAVASPDVLGCPVGSGDAE